MFSFNTRDILVHSQWHFARGHLSSLAALNKVIVFTESNETFKMGTKKKESLHRMPLQCLTTFHDSANTVYVIFESSLSKYIVHGLWTLQICAAIAHLRNKGLGNERAADCIMKCQRVMKRVAVRGPNTQH